MSPHAEQAAPRRTRTVRQRLLAMMVAVMTIGLTTTGIINFGLQWTALNERVAQELEQEVSELALLAQTGPAQDGEPYTDAQALFLAFLTTAVTSDDEAILAMVEGEGVIYSAGERRFEVQDASLLATVRELEVEPGRSRVTTLRTQGTQLRVLVADVQLPTETRASRLVVVNDIGRQLAELRRDAVTYAVLSVLVLAAVAGLSHLLLGRLLRPLEDLRAATALTSTDDLSQRVQVEAADTDVAELAVRFNSMLDRIEGGVAQQRQFLDDAAHELRTPLTIVRGNAELLRADDPDDVESARALILDEVDRMQRLVDDLLMLARSQRPDFFRPAPVDVTELALEAMERITSLGDRAWRLHAGAEGTAGLDRQRVLQALVQLAANAVKFSKPGSVVELATSWASPTSEVARRAMAAGAVPAARYLVLQVRDEGIGIPADQQQRIFERFGRADNIGPADGSGLGLAIVAAIAQAHSGAIGVDSVEGSGSTFTLWLPDA